MAASTIHNYAKCGDEYVMSMHVDPQACREFFRNGYGFPEIPGPPVGSMEFAERLPQIEDVIFPKERFVTYEKSDAKWAVPLGIAKRVMRTIRPNDRLEVKVQNESMLCDVTGIGLRYRSDRMTVYVVEFVLIGLMP